MDILLLVCFNKGVITSKEDYQIVIYIFNAFNSWKLSPKKKKKDYGVLCWPPYRFTHLSTGTPMLDLPFTILGDNRLNAVSSVVTGLFKMPGLNLSNKKHYSMKI